MNRVPLAERMRPKTLKEVVGQDDIIGPGKILTEIVKKKEPVNLIFWGPPGTGKTTLARILAHEFKSDFVEISAVTSGKKDVEAVVERAKGNWNLGQRTVLFVDEIHRFNKAQQDAFLPHVESGLITLIGATTENPSFEVIPPLLSRSRVVIVAPLDKKSILKVLKKAVKAENIDITSDALNYLAELSGGDARSALGDLELAASLDQHITKDTVSRATEQLYIKTLESLVPQFALEVLLMDKSIVSVQEGRERKGVIGIKVGKHIVSTEWFQDVAFCTSRIINTAKTMNFEEADCDMNGEENQRDILLKNPDLEFPAFEKARKLGGYVPAIGELKEAFLSLAEINITRFALGLENIPWGYWFYSSSMRSADSVWFLDSDGYWYAWRCYGCLGCWFHVLPFFSSCE